MKSHVIDPSLTYSNLIISLAVSSGGSEDFPKLSFTPKNMTRRQIHAKMRSMIIEGKPMTSHEVKLIVEIE